MPCTASAIIVPVMVQGCRSLASVCHNNVEQETGFDDYNSSDRDTLI